MTLLADSKSYSMIDVFPGDDHRRAETFHNWSKLNRTNAADLGRRIAAIVRNPGILRMMSRSWKSYEGYPTIPLPRAGLGDVRLEDAIQGRRSLTTARKTYSGAPIDLEDLAAVLLHSYGVTGADDNPYFPGEKLYWRASPSAGGLHPLEIYPVVFDVNGLPSGIYHYRVVDHSLEVLSQRDPKEGFFQTVSDPTLGAGASVVLVITGVIRRTLTKYLFRGYRFAMTDAGALLQNLYLTSQGRGLGYCPIGGFYDDDLGRLIGIDNVDEHALVCFSMGRVADD